MASKIERILPDNTNDLLYVKLTQGDVTKHCGYRKDYLSQNLSEMEQELIVCRVCTGIMREPSLYKGDTTCLVCSETPEELNSVKGIQVSVSKLEIKCPLLRDCNWNGKLSEAEVHLETCLCFLIECTECKQVIQREDKSNHEAHVCEMRQIACMYDCGKAGLAKDMKKHFEYCANYPVTCPNECGVSLVRQQLSAHKTECELEKVSCPYSEYGCRVKPMFRRDLLAHKKEFYIEHADISLMRIKTLEREKDELKLELKKTKKLDGIKWDINRIHLGIGSSRKGPTFYVNNYKLRVCVKIFKKLTRLNLGFRLKRIEGEFDSQLREASITQYRVIVVDKQNNTKSQFQVGRMNYPLKIGSNSEYFYSIAYPKSLIQNDHFFVELYFDTKIPNPINYDAGPLETFEPSNIFLKDPFK